MCGLVRFVCTCFFWLTVVHVVVCDVSVLFFCEADLSVVCGEIADSMLPEQLQDGPGGPLPSSYPSTSPVPSVLSPSSVDYIRAKQVYPVDGFIENVRLLQNTVLDDQSISVFVGFGADHVVNAVATVAVETNVTAILYTTSHHRKLIYEDRMIPIHPDHAGLARTIDTVVGHQMLLKSYIICEDSLASDGFLDTMAELGVNVSFIVTVSRSENESSLRLKLLHIHDIGIRVMIVHVTPTLFERISAVAQELSYFSAGFAWILTEEVLGAAERFGGGGGSIPTGVLAVAGDEQDRYEMILIAVIRAVTEEIARLYSSAEKHGLLKSDIGDRFRHTVSSQKFNQSDFIRAIKKNHHLFAPNGTRKSVQYKLLNYVREPEDDYARWKTVGYVIGSDLELDTVIWPGQSIFGPVSLAREFYTVVTRPAEPFVYIRGPVITRNDCAVNNVCLKIYAVDAASIKDAVESYRYRKQDMGANFTLYCCEGIVVDILHSLSVELRFDFLLYFKAADRYGHRLNNGSWTGIIGDVCSGAADLLAGAISITSERMEALLFTESFYYSSFNMVSARDRPVTTLWAFTRPFDFILWFLIIISATIVALATALYEWNSPFGLNPWGKKRKRNYTLGSAMNMVYSLWFGHTVKTKSPKSWPSKVLQNFWAATAIFITAGYTANLAAFLAGNAYQDSAYSILDAQITSKKVGVVATSAVEEYTKALNAGLHTRFSQYHVDDIQNGIMKIRSGELDLYMDDTPLLEYALATFATNCTLKSGELDLYMDDTPLLEYALATYDTNCTLKYAAHSFGDNSYAFAMKSGSWLKERFDPLILNYVELGVIEDLKWRYMGKARQCENKLMSKDDLGFGLTHTGGLFIMLLVGLGISILLLIGEYFTYYLLLPRLRKKPNTAIWKRRNFEFFSQRLYRAINSEKVAPPAQELVSKVRQKKFQLQSQIQGKLVRQSASVPAALKSYMFTQQSIRKLAFSESEQYDDFNIRRDTNGSIFTISGNEVPEPGDDNDNDSDRCIVTRQELVEFHHSMSSPLLFSRIGKSGATTVGFDNPIFESDEDEEDIGEAALGCRGNNNRNSVRNTRVAIVHDSVKNTNETASAAMNSSNKTDTNKLCRFCKSKDKRYVTWPSPKTRKKSVKRCQNNNSKQSTHPTRELPSDNKRIVNEISRKNTRSRSSSSLDSYHGNSQRLELKDNRVKSNLRQHAMGTLPRSPSVSLDDGAVEALSKEDLLVLWKKSEIELQTKLNRMLHQNNHLRQLVDIAEEGGRAGRGGRAEPSQAEAEEARPPGFKCSRL